MKKFSMIGGATLVNTSLDLLIGSLTQSARTHWATCNTRTNNLVCLRRKVEKSSLFPIVFPATIVTPQPPLPNTTAIILSSTQHHRHLLSSTSILHLDVSSCSWVHDQISLTQTSSTCVHAGTAPQMPQKRQPQPRCCASHGLCARPGQRWQWIRRRPRRPT